MNEHLFIMCALPSTLFIMGAMLGIYCGRDKTLCKAGILFMLGGILLAIRFVFLTYMGW